MLVGTREGFGMLLVYCVPQNPVLSFLELVDFISAAALRSPKLIVLDDFNVHAEVGATGPALEFLETMASLDIPSLSTVPPTWWATH